MISTTAVAPAMAMPSHVNVTTPPDMSPSLWSWGRQRWTRMKHPNNPACTRGVSLQNVKVGHYTEQEEEKEEEEEVEEEVRGRDEEETVEEKKRVLCLLTVRDTDHLQQQSVVQREELGLHPVGGVEVRGRDVDHRSELAGFHHTHCALRDKATFTLTPGLGLKKDCQVVRKEIPPSPMEVLFLKEKYTTTRKITLPSTAEAGGGGGWGWGWRLTKEETHQ